MSSDLYLRCEDHNPPLLSEVVGKDTLADRNAVRARVELRSNLVTVREYLDYDDRMLMPIVRFFSQHPRCRFIICDKYGSSHPNEETR